jgi:hypothetical protein
VHGRCARVRILRHGKTIPKGGERAVEIAEEVPRETEMIMNIVLQRADGNVPFVRLAVGLDDVGFAAHESSGPRQVLLGPAEPPNRYETMAAVAQQFGAVGVRFETLGKYFNCIVEAPDVGKPPAQPHDRLEIPRVAFEGGARGSKVGLERGAPLRGKRRRRQRTAVERERLGAAGNGMGARRPGPVPVMGRAGGQL